MTSTRRRGWSKSIGERGHRIRLYEARPGGPLMRSIWMHGKEDRKSWAIGTEHAPSGRPMSF